MNMDTGNNSKCAEGFKEYLISSKDNMFALGFLSSMFNGGWGNPTLPKLDEKDFEKVNVENKAE